MKLDDNREREIYELMSICKDEQGGFSDYVCRGFATTYSWFFLRAAAEIYVVLVGGGCKNPIAELSRRFQINGVRSCRGARMDVAKTKYLYSAHLSGLIERGNGIGVVCFYSMMKSARLNSGR